MTMVLVNQIHLLCLDKILVDIGGEYLVSVHQVKALGAVLKMASGELGKLFFDEVSLSVYNILSLI